MCHQFNTDEAVRYGLVEAILLYHIRFWLEKNRADGVNIHDGRVWTYMPITSLTAVFAYLTERQIRYAINHLLQEGILISDYFGDKRDRTKWYSLEEFSAGGDTGEDAPSDAGGDDRAPNQADDRASSEGVCLEKLNKQPAKSDGYATYKNDKCNLQICQLQLTNLSVDNKEEDNSTKDIPPYTPPQGESERELVRMFDRFRQSYRGTRRGLETELDNLKRKHRNWRDIVPMLLPLYEAQCRAKDALRAAGQFVPQEKNLKTYLNQNGWEEEFRQPVTDRHQEYDSHVVE